MFRLRSVSPVGSPATSGALRAEGFFVTVVNAQGRDGDARIAFTVLPRQKVPVAKRAIERIGPAAFATFEATTPGRPGALLASRPRK